MGTVTVSRNAPNPLRDLLHNLVGSHSLVAPAHLIAHPYRYPKLNITACGEATAKNGLEVVLLFEQEPTMVRVFLLDLRHAGERTRGIRSDVQAGAGHSGDFHDRLCDRGKPDRSRVTSAAGSSPETLWNFRLGPKTQRGPGQAK